MSSLSASRADNFYYPPGYEPSKHGSINKFQGSHPLGKRADRLQSEGILIIRFEIPYKIWCLGCHCVIDKGVRFNAEKKKVGNYFTTPIYLFRMQCKKCRNWISIKTDPKNAIYLLEEGAREKKEQFDEADAETIKLESFEGEREKVRNDPFFRLEREGEEHRRDVERKKETKRLKALMDLSHQVSYDSYATNSLARAKLRTDRLAEQTAAAAAAAAEITTTNQTSALLLPPMIIPLLPPSQQDQITANRTCFATDHLLVRDSYRTEYAKGAGIFSKSYNEIERDQIITNKKRQERIQNQDRKQREKWKNLTEKQHQKLLKKEYQKQQRQKQQRQLRRQNKDENKDASIQAGDVVRGRRDDAPPPRTTTPRTSTAVAGRGSRLKCLLEKKAELHLIRQRDAIFSHQICHDT